MHGRTEEREPSSDGAPRRIAGRYQVRGVLGRGGMAIAYHVVDTVTQRELALKQLTMQGDDEQGAAALFEREFHTLEAYDYGVAGDGPYYTMQLLDGGDLRQRTPLPWREACALAYDVCSSLALIHSRRLVHREITPRNVRCTRDSQAKLIDFGAMAPMGPGGVIVGTPAFVAPEVVLGSALDARADLFSLGATPDGAGISSWTRLAPRSALPHLFEGADTMSDHSGRILDVLCSGNASAAGYLYLCTEAGPTLVAARGAEEPGRLLDYVCECLMRDLGAGDGETAMVSVEETRFSAGATIFTDHAGRTYRPTFLTVFVGDVPRHAAIAILADATGERRTVDFALTSALANYMIEAGDTRGVAAGE